MNHIICTVDVVLMTLKDSRLQVALLKRDHAPFAEIGVPVFYFMAAMHPDYHQPSDELSKINWEKMTNIIRIGFLNTWELANSNEFMQKKE